MIATAIVAAAWIVGTVVAIRWYARRIRRGGA